MSSPQITVCILIAALLGSSGCKTMLPASQPVSASPETQVRGAGGAQIRFAETMHDFGELANGASVKHDFVFTNTGTTTLEVTDVSPECSCANTGAWSRTVEPGRTGTIPIRFDTTTLSGPILKRVAVTCNSPTQSLTVLTIKATVWQAIEVTPSSVYFTPQDEIRTVQTKVVRIVNHTPQPLELSPPECRDTAFTAGLRTLAEGREFELRIAAREPFGPGPIRSRVTIRTSSKLLPVISLDAVVLPSTAVAVAPPQLMLRPGPLAAATTAGVTLRHSGSTAVTISDASVNVPGVKASIEEPEPGHVFHIMVEFPAGFKTEPSRHAELCVKTSHPQFPVVRVPIFQPQ